MEVFVTLVTYAVSCALHLLHVSTTVLCYNFRMSNSVTNSPSKQQQDDARTGTPLSPLVLVTVPKQDKANKPRPIPLTSETDRKIERLEALILAQHEQTQNLSQTVNKLLPLLGNTSAKAFAPSGEEQADAHFSEEEEEGEVEVIDDSDNDGQDFEADKDLSAPLEEDQSAPDAGFAIDFVPVTAGPAIADEVARGLNYVLRNPLDPTAIAELNKANKPPANVPALVTPECNPSIYKSVQGHNRTVENALQDLHELLVPAIVAVAKLAPSQMTPEWGQALTALGHTSYELNMTRRRLLKPTLQQKYVQLCSPAVKLTTQLFGDDLSKDVRDITDVNKATEKMMKQHNRPAPYNRNKTRKRIQVQSPKFKQQQAFLAGKAPPRQPKTPATYTQTAAKGATRNQGASRGKAQSHYRQ